MNTCKIQQDILKLLFRKPEDVIHCDLRDGSAAAVGTNIAVYVIPKDEYFLNVNSADCIAIRNCIEERYRWGYKLSEYVRDDEVKYTTRLQSGKTKEKHIKVAIFKSENSYTVIDKKYLIYFADGGANFYINESSRSTPVMVYDDYYNLLAAICPINVHIEEFENE